MAEQKEVQTKQEHVETLKKAYQDFETHLLRNGIFLARDTGIGYWGVTHIEALHTALQEAEIHKHKQFIDLGSGDGRVVLMAAAMGVKATGIEADDWLTNSALDMKRKIKHPSMENAQFFKEDFMKMDLTKYDFIYVSPDKPFYRGLDQKLKREATGKVLVHGFEFHPSTLNKEKEIMYPIPAKPLDFTFKNIKNL